MNLDTRLASYALPLATVVLAIAAAGPSAASSDEQPRVVNARVETRAVTAGLDKEFRALVAAQTSPAWIGYSAPMVPGEHHMCCYDSRDQIESSNGLCARCRLEEGRGSSVTSDGVERQGTVKLESSRRVLVLFRVEGKHVQKIRSFSDDCELDAGGLPLCWLTGVQPTESVDLLGSFVVSSFAARTGADEDEDEDGEHLGDSALAALAMHAGPEADQALERFVAPSEPERLREKASFWLGAARGKRGYEMLSRMVRDDPSDGVREKAVFALYVSKEPEAMEEMIRVAHSDQSSRVRGQALFWLAQRAGQRAARAITEAIERDPETEVKKKAVFALSQLPKDQGVPLLIQVARNNRNPAVRKQAMFWLGQSNDPRALEFFEEVLEK